MGDVCGGEGAVMDRVIEEWHRALVPYALPDAVRAVPDAACKGFNLKKYMKWFYDGSTVDDNGQSGVKACTECDTFWNNLSRHKDIAIASPFPDVLSQFKCGVSEVFGTCHRQKFAFMPILPV